MTDALLQLRISVDYARKPGVLRDFSLQVAEGEIVGLVGPSGEGKTPSPCRSSDYWLEGARVLAAKS
jgi:ABC-type lipopolysaccharide export system ATPase subunit